MPHCGYLSTSYDCIKCDLKEIHFIINKNNSTLWQKLEEKIHKQKKKVCVAGASHNIITALYSALRSVNVQDDTVAFLWWERVNVFGEKMD